jgi:hypothetical protein
MTQHVSPGRVHPLEALGRPGLPDDPDEAFRALTAIDLRLRKRTTRRDMLEKAMAQMRLADWTAAAETAKAACLAHDDAESNFICGLALVHLALAKAGAITSSTPPPPDKAAISMLRLAVHNLTIATEKNAEDDEAVELLQSILPFVSSAYDEDTLHQMLREVPQP